MPETAGGAASAASVDLTEQRILPVRRCLTNDTNHTRHTGVAPSTASLLQISLDAFSLFRTQEGKDSKSIKGRSPQACSLYALKLSAARVTGAAARSERSNPVPVLHNEGLRTEDRGPGSSGERRAPSGKRREKGQNVPDTTASSSLSDGHVDQCRTFDPTSQQEELGNANPPNPIRTCVS